MLKDISGNKYGKLTVIRLVGMKGKVSQWLCQCECGNQKVVGKGSLTSGNTQSCGCIHKAQLVNRNYKHGKVKSPIYHIWSCMKDRCNNPHNISYKNYGGRGIRVSAEWMNFENFHNDMIATYLKGLTLERKDNNGDYCKENCVWADNETQANNNRRNNIITYGGTSGTLANMAKIWGFDYVVVQSRLYKGWDITKAIEAPATTYNTYSLNGETLPLIDFCKRYNQPYSRVQKRLEKGWELEKALTTPKTNRYQNKEGK